MTKHLNSHQEVCPVFCNFNLMILYLFGSMNIKADFVSCNYPAENKDQRPEPIMPPCFVR